MKVNICPDPDKQDSQLVFIRLTVKEALSQIISLAAQIQSGSPNVGREEITDGSTYLSITVDPEQKDDENTEFLTGACDAHKMLIKTLKEGIVK